MPLCRPEGKSSSGTGGKRGSGKKPARKWGGLGEVLQGDRLVDSQLELRFLEPVSKDKQRVCSQVLDADAAESLSRAVRNHFWFELFLDDLPVWGFIGSPPPPPGESEEELHVYTHRAFDISYNGAFRFIAREFCPCPGSKNSLAKKRKRLRRPSPFLFSPLFRPPPSLLSRGRLPQHAAAADRIIQVNLTSENPRPLAEGTELVFTYEVRWSPDATGAPFSRRFEKYLDRDFFQHRVHWWALANAAATVAFLTALVAAILVRALRADVARYNGVAGAASSSSAAAAAARALGGSPPRPPALGDLDGDFDDESGWKVLSGDVFRAPKNLHLLSALVGTGAQLCLLALLTSAGAALGSLFVERGSVTTVAVVLYALTSVVGGYVAGENFTRCSGGGGGGSGGIAGKAGSSSTKQQARTWLLTATILPLSTFAVGGGVNTVALLYKSLAAVPFKGVAGVLALWLLLSVPLCRLGFALGRRRWQRRLLLGGGGGAGSGGAGSSAGDPARTKRVPSPIPAKPWHRSRLVVCTLAGLLPFLSILVVS